MSLKPKRNPFPARLACALVVAVGTLAGLTGCGEDESRRPRPEVEVGSNGRLMSAPEPLTLADVNRQPRNSPQQAIWRMLFWAQWGNPTNTLAQYDDLVRRRLGGLAASTYSWLRPTLVTLRPRLVEVSPAGEGTFVGLELLSDKSPPRRESFLLRRGRDGDWKILYDTFLDRGFVQYVLYSETGSAASRGEGRATEKAEQTARAYLTIALDEARDEGRREARRRRSRQEG